MAHEISTASGKPEFIYVEKNGRPWHSLGLPLSQEVSAAEAARLAFPWSVESRKLVTCDGLDVPGKRGVVRLDTQKVIGCVGTRHTLVQPQEFAEAVDAIFAGHSVVDTAGALGIGERIFILSKLPNGFEVRRGDLVERYLLAVNTFDGSGSLALLMTPVRVVCSNTLGLALRTASNVIRIRHTRNVKVAMDQASKILARSESYWTDLRAFLSSLVEQQITVESFKAFVAALIPDTMQDDNGNSVPSPQAQATRNRLTALFEGQDLIGSDLDGGHNKYRALNVVTQWIRTERPVRGSTNRIESDLFGDGAAGILRQRATELLAKPL